MIAALLASFGHGTAWRAVITLGGIGFALDALIRTALATGH